MIRFELTDEGKRVLDKCNKENKRVREWCKKQGFKMRYWELGGERMGSGFYILSNDYQLDTMGVTPK